MDPATPLQPYTPAGTDTSGQPQPAMPSPQQAAPFSDPTSAGQLQPLAPLSPLAPLAPAGSVATPAIVPGQPYLDTSTPPATSMPLAPLVPLAPDYSAGAPQADNGPVDVKHELIEQLRKANNVLVTVSSNPSIDQLSAAIGITLVLNKLDKHATAVYSGETPSVLEFLQPDKTIEKNTDSLRDFIIALDKAKADKLRYKVEDKFVKIFITPYHTSLSESDLEFSQGDFNVDVVLALGVHRREELDQAITAHGRILHDAVTISVNNEQPSDLGTLNWFQSDASSLAEMLVSLVEPLQGEKIILDEQIATAFLTGVVAETERFSNIKTTPFTMNVSATLMKAGANQQLVSSKLDAPQPVPEAKEGAKLDEIAKEGAEPAPIPTVASDGSLAIEHKKEEPKPAKTLADLEKENHAVHDDGEEDSDLAKIHIDEEGKLLSSEDMAPSAPVEPSAVSQVTSNMVTQPPSMGGAMTATTLSENAVQPSVDTPAEDQTGLQHAKTITPLSDAEKQQTLADIEKTVDSSHLSANPTEAADAARQAVDAANASVDSERLEPVSALNAQPIDLQTPTAAEPAPDADLTNEEVFPVQLVGPDKGLPADPTAGASDPSAPPPVPPPMMPTS